MAWRKLHPLLFIMLIFSACKEESVFVNPSSLELVNSVDCEIRPHSILACPCEGDFLVLGMKLIRFNKHGEFVGTMVDFNTFDQGNHPRYLPRDMAMDEYRKVYILCSPVMDTTGGFWTTTTGFSILVFDPVLGFIDELDYSAHDGGLARMLACHNGSLFTCYSPEIKRIHIRSGEMEDIPFPEDPGKDDFLLHTFSDMEITEGGRIYFCGPYSTHPDSATSRILTMEKDYKEFTEYVSMDQHMVYASMIGSPGLALHQDGNIFLANFYGSSVEVYSHHMGFLFSHSMEAVGDRDPLPIDLATYRDRLYVLDYANQQVVIYTCTY